MRYVIADEDKVKFVHFNLLACAYRRQPHDRQLV